MVFNNNNNLSTIGLKHNFDKLEILQRKPTRFSNGSYGLYESLQFTAYISEFKEHIDNNVFKVIHVANCRAYRLPACRLWAW